MAASEPSASIRPDQEPPFHRFPPFPEPPPGVTIMPFRDFKARGIQLFSEPKVHNDGSGDEDDAELDGLGIPTVELRVKHATDECKSHTHKKRRKKKAAPVVDAVPVQKRPWYEEWEEGEDLRVTRVRYDARVSAVDRFFQSAYEFRTGRPWPPVSSGLNNIWDQFRLFTGLLVNPSVYRKAGTKKGVRADSPDEVSDDEEDVEMDVVEGAPASDARPTKRQRPDDAADIDEDDPHKSDEDMREEKASLFLADPEKSVRIFLSSYMREHGLIWTERNLIHTPRLVHFFLAFVVRNRVLLEPAYQRGLKHALERAKWAKKELPLTHKVGQSMPDPVNEACRECFGRKGGINWSVVNASSTTDQKNADITVTDVCTGARTNVALPTETQTQLKDAIEDNVDMDVSLHAAAADVAPTTEDAAGGNEWGSGWGDPWTDDGSWGRDPQAQGDSWGGGPQGTSTAERDAKWADSNPTWSRDPISLISLLGPSVFPLTHTTGIVECSTRRVSAVHFPSGHPKGTALSSVGDLGKTTVETGEQAGWTPSACGVEEELDARFAKVVLEPWGREEGDISGPEIWDTSRGPVIDPKKPSQPVSADLGRKPHNPLTDNITLLVHPSFAETLVQVPGLGLGAMWVEMARCKRGGGVDGLGEVDTDTSGRFWYHEDVTGIFPSFYTPREE